MEFRYDVVPEGVYQGEYNGYEEGEITNKQTGKPDKILRHYWTVQVGDTRVKSSCLSDIKYTPHNRFGKIVKALLGRDLQPLEGIDPSRFMGKSATLIFESKDGNIRIMNVLPPKIPNAAEQKKKDAEAFI
jgi:hypothetical protein